MYNRGGLSKNKITILVGIFIFIFVVAILFFASINRHKQTDLPEIKLTDSKEIEINIGETYQELGAMVENSLDHGTYTIEITKGGHVISSINTLQVGTYQITYQVTENGKTAKVERTVNIIDDVAPHIVIHQPYLHVPFNEISTFDLLDKMSVSDNVDGQIDPYTMEVIAPTMDQPAVYEIEYRVKDSLGNVATAKRTINAYYHVSKRGAYALKIENYGDLCSEFFPIPEQIGNILVL